MGWSCSEPAWRVIETWTKACKAQSGISNVYIVDGKEFMWESSRKEHGGGAITGGVYGLDAAGYARSAGSFRIEGDGTVSRWPAHGRAILDVRPKAA